MAPSGTIIRLMALATAMEHVQETERPRRRSIPVDGWTTMPVMYTSASVDRVRRAKLTVLIEDDHGSNAVSSEPQKRTTEKAWEVGIVSSKNGTGQLSPASLS